MVIEVKYKAKDANSRTLLNHTLFGRVVYKDRRGKKTAYYTKGILDNTLYCRKTTSNIKICVKGDVTNFIKYIFDTLALFGEVSITTLTTDEELQWITGKQHWKKKALERGYKFHE